MHQLQKTTLAPQKRKVLVVIMTRPTKNTFTFDSAYTPALLYKIGKVDI